MRVSKANTINWIVKARRYAPYHNYFITFEFKVVITIIIHSDYIYNKGRANILDQYTVYTCILFPVRNIDIALILKISPEPRNKLQMG